MSILKKIKDKTGTIHDLGDSRVDAFEMELSGAEHNVPYSPAVLAKTNAIEASVSSHIGNTANPHKVSKAQIGLANVENKSSTQIRSELTKENVTNALGYTPIDESRIGAANGVASLDASGRIPASQIPGGFDNIEEYDNLAAFPTTGEEGKIYVAKDTNITYRWTGSQYVEISPSLALGETATTAYRGDRGKVAYDHSQVSGNSTIHHTHANKELLDSYKQTEADLANAVAKVHEHANKDVLDGITSSAVANWNSKQNSLTFDDEPTAGSTNPVTSDGIKTAISNSVDQTYSPTSTKAQSGVAVNEAFKTRETSTSGDSYTYIGMKKTNGGNEELYWKLVSFNAVNNYWTLQFEIDVSNGKKGDASFDLNIYETKRLTISGTKPGFVSKASELRYVSQGLDLSRGYGNNLYYEISSSNLLTVYIKAINQPNKTQLCRLKDFINFQGISNITWHEATDNAGTQPTNPVKFKEFFPAIASTSSDIGSDSVPVYVSKGKPVSCKSSNLKAGKDDDGNVIKNTYAKKTELDAKGIVINEIDGENVICFE